MKKLNIVWITLLFTALCLNDFAQSNTQPFKVEVTGKGNLPIIFIPGFACSGDVWKDTKTMFEDKYTCYTLTMAGFAGVPAQPGSTFKSWEKGIANYIQQHKINKPIIIGHSMGGGLALALAADYPDLASDIVVVDALPCLAAMTDPSFKSKKVVDCTAMVSRFSGMSDDQFKLSQTMGMARMMTDTTHLKQAVGWSVASDRKTFAEIYCDFMNTDLREKIAAIKCPALILLESYFANFKPTITDQYKNLKTAQLQYATKGLHFIMFDDPTWYNNQLTTFIK